MLFDWPRTSVLSFGLAAAVKGRRERMVAAQTEEEKQTIGLVALFARFQAAQKRLKQFNGGSFAGTSQDLAQGRSIQFSLTTSTYSAYSSARAMLVWSFRLFSSFSASVQEMTTPVEVHTACAFVALSSSKGDNTSNGSRRFRYL